MLEKQQVVEGTVKETLLEARQDKSYPEYLQFCSD